MAAINEVLNKPALAVSSGTDGNKTTAGGYASQVSGARNSSDTLTPPSTANKCGGLEQVPVRNVNGRSELDVSIKGDVGKVCFMKAEESADASLFMDVIHGMSGKLPGDVLLTLTDVYNYTDIDDDALSKLMDTVQKQPEYVQIAVFGKLLENKDMFGYVIGAVRQLSVNNDDMFKLLYNAQLMLDKYMKLEDIGLRRAVKAVGEYWGVAAEKLPVDKLEGLLDRGLSAMNWALDNKNDTLVSIYVEAAGHLPPEKQEQLRLNLIATSWKTS